VCVYVCTRVYFDVCMCVCILPHVPVIQFVVFFEATEGLGMGTGGIGGGARATVSTAPIAFVGCEYTIYYKEA